MEITKGEGVKAVIDGIGLATYETSIDVLAAEASSSPSVTPPVPSRRSAAQIYQQVWLPHRPKLNDYTVTREELMERANDIFKWIGSGDLQVAVDRCFPLEQAVEGHNYSRLVRASNKVLYEIP